MKFSTTDKEATLHGVKILVYGAPKVGKTRLCATAPTPIILSAEAGLLSLSQYSIPVIKIDSFQDLMDAYMWLARNEDKGEFQTICLDSISEICEVILATEKKKVKDARMAYGEMIETSIAMIKGFRDLPNRHVYMTAKVEVKDGKEAILIPGSKLGFMIPYLFDEVFRMGIDQTDKGETYNYLQTSGCWQFYAGDRSGKLDPIEPSDLSVIISKIIGV